METMYFVLGMLSIVAAAFVAVIVWGLLKIRKQESEIKMLNRMNEDNHRLIYSMVEDVNRRINIEIQNLDQVVSNNRREFLDETKELNQHFSRRLEDVWGVFRDIRNEMVELSKSDVELSKSYTDSRIDKLIDTYFDVVGAKKQIIK
jgi:hypothetical protein